MDLRRYCRIGWRRRWHSRGAIRRRGLRRYGGTGWHGEILLHGEIVDNRSNDTCEKHNEYPKRLMLNRVPDRMHNHHDPENEHEEKQHNEEKEEPKSPAQELLGVMGHLST